MKINNIFSNIEKNIPKEIFETIAQSSNTKIERIISKAHSTPEGKWYDQDDNEFVIIVKGDAEILFDNNEKISIKQGDYIIIPAHKKHRVEKTSQKEKTIWLVFFYK